MVDYRRWHVLLVQAHHSSTSMLMAESLWCSWALVWIKAMTDLHRLTGIAILHHPSPAYFQNGTCRHLWGDYPVWGWVAEQKQGSGSPSSWRSLLDILLKPHFQ